MKQQNLDKNWHSVAIPFISCCWVKGENIHQLSLSTLFSFLQRFLQAFKFPKNSGGKLLRHHSSSERENALRRWSVGCHTAQRGNKKTTRKKEEKQEDAAAGDNPFTTISCRRKAGFCYTLALLLFLSKQCGSEGKGRVSLQTSRDKIFISRCRFKKPFILRYLSIVHVVIFFFK